MQITNKQILELSCERHKDAETNQSKNVPPVEVVAVATVITGALTNCTTSPVTLDFPLDPPPRPMRPEDLLLEGGLAVGVKVVPPVATQTVSSPKADLAALADLALPPFVFFFIMRNSRRRKASTPCPEAWGARRRKANNVERVTFIVSSEFRNEKLNGLFAIRYVHERGGEKGATYILHKFENNHCPPNITFKFSTFLYVSEGCIKMRETSADQ